MLKEFKDFINKGNMIDLAVGLVIGAAFGKVTEGMMTFIVNPLVGLLGGKGFNDLFWVIRDGETTKGPYASLKAAGDAGAAVVGYGAFFSALLNFVIVGFVMFLVVKGYNKMKRGEPVAELAPPADVALLTEIRDLLAKK